MTYNIENFTVRTLIQPSIHLYLLLTSKALKETDKKIILDSLINEDIQTIIDTIEINIIATQDTDTPEGILLGMQARLFITEIRQSYSHIRDLHYHKDDNNISKYLGTIRDTLEKHNVPKEVAQELYSNLMDINNKPKTATRSTVKDNVQKMLLKDSLRKGKK